MDITVPTWLIWLLGLGVVGAVLFLAFVGAMFFYYWEPFK